MLESIRGIDETQQYHGGEKRLKEISDRTEQLSVRQGVLNRLTGTNLALANTLILVFDMTMLLLSAILYTSGAVGFDGFLIPLIALMSSFGPVSALAALGTTLQNTVASGARVLAIVDEEPETEDVNGMPDISFEGALANNVSFSYGGDTVLKDLSLVIPKGKVTGIVGRSGCGKSTLLKLLMRFWKVSDGQISVSDRDIEEINTTDLRNMESYMTPEPQLCQDSIANTVRIGKLDATEEEIEKACKKASINYFIITLPKGNDNPVGELGDTLSG
ncbi:MAG: ABC transporter ATP-binding protein, partial [Oscillospiraceae bacterium]|nr:ABC transporter ATP-binding protein [Oscillospiraceae bacterium]